MVRTTNEKAIDLVVRVTPTGQQDGLDSAVLAMVGAGCALTKARYTVDSGRGDFVEGKCGNMNIKFAQLTNDTKLLISCELAVGVDACKAQFTKVLNEARVARYIK
jgi:hypothetical protein